MEYSEEFNEAVKFSNKNKLFLGYGNPNGKILMIGKEHYFNHSIEEDSLDFYKEILNARELENQNNFASWENNINNNFEPKWPLGQEFYCDNSNAFTAWWNQRNIQDDKKGNCGTSNTYLHYQKLYQNVFLDGQKEERINF
jgi:phage-related tail fiber protein